MAKLIRIIELRKIRTWLDKSKDGAWPKGTMRIYVGNLLLGIAVPDRDAQKEGKELYRFHSIETFVDSSTVSEAKGLQTILDDLEMSLKEFAARFVKRLAVLKKVKEIDLPD